MATVEPAWVTATIGVGVVIVGGLWAMGKREARNAGYEPRIDSHDRQIRDHEHRITTLEAVCPELEKRHEHAH